MGALSNAKWVAFSQGSRIALQFAGIAVLSRMIPASEFGIMAMAMTIGNFSNLIRDMGTAAAIIQKVELTQETKTSVFWVNILFGVVVCLIVFLSSGLVANFFRQPILQYVLIAISFSFPLSSSASVHQALMEKSSRFRELAQIEIAASFFALIAAISFAAFGFGLVGLVAQILLNSIISTLLIWKSSKWIPSRGLFFKEISGIYSFSANLSLFNIINYFSRNSDGLIIGRHLSPLELGNYSMAYRLMLFPVQSMSFTITRALFPIMSIKQDNAEDLGVFYIKSLALVSAVTAPMMAIVWITRDLIVPVALGSQWEMVSPLLAWLAPVGFIQSIVSTTGSTLMARGRTDLLLRLGVFGTALHIGAFAFGIRYGLTGIVVFYFFSNLLNALPALYFSLRQLEKGFKDLFLSIGPSILAALSSAVLVLGARAQLDGYILSSGIKLVLYGLLCVTCYAGLLIMQKKVFGWNFLPKRN